MIVQRGISIYNLKVYPYNFICLFLAPQELPVFKDLYFKVWYFHVVFVYGQSLVQCREGGPFTPLLPQAA